MEILYGYIEFFSLFQVRLFPISVTIMPAYGLTEGSSLSAQALLKARKEKDNLENAILNDLINYCQQGKWTGRRSFRGS